MRYQMQEGSFELPDGLQDNSMHMFMTGNSGLDMSLIATRERLEAGESFGAYMERQFKSVAMQVKDFKMGERLGDTAIPAKGLASLEYAQTFRQNGQTVHQRQRTWLLADQCTVLVLTAASMAPLTEAQKTRWRAICDSFQPRA
ncbi:DUF1795 domain-containing protein [Paracidovorax avenae]|uniref:DUF1795 domain-containing protein n=1 Tax=Paracidovorax avenae (strain ATCC 19860 / DSM 7227 / CCUG 15838 / JCM 20985 / LMG 2117 / NCPPB 1011) TaxID=643561 RepID=F0Q823_PARA1|nr:DcrB-related protein [Paracidovorax avenae]ADX45821.1 hypothetical protein Acav_1906 [Paracidovorax avenae ATCC 19860]AVS67955.1 DUF1795 domain-containing protein [Paracidovorax avenae]AVT16181.1 DUF1795 domain-containing protein [Paracidovorax avenae]